MTLDPARLADACTGCLLGTAVGDATGLPYEGLSRRRVLRWMDDGLRYRLILGRGLVSDDTEHAAMAAQSLIEAGDDVERFARRLARRLRWWLAALPAGTGWATLRAILRLWLGFPPARSGVRSAGNGPAMRAAIIGVAAGDDLARLRALVRASTRMTHTDPRAEQGALAVALAARMAAEAGGDVPPEDYGRTLRRTMPGDEAVEWLGIVDRVVDSAVRGQATEDFAADLGLAHGVSGYVYHSVPVALQAWLTHPRDLGGAIVALIRCGGDTDSTAAIAGGIVGAGTGPEGIPQDSLARLVDWPRSVGWLGDLGSALAGSHAAGPRAAPTLPPLAILLRNAAFLMVVLAHGLRRLLPPY